MSAMVRVTVHDPNLALLATDETTSYASHTRLAERATRIIFDGDKMKVLSPSSTSNTKISSGCYNTQDPNTEQTITPIPPVVYVDPSTSTCTVGATGYPAIGEAYTSDSSTAISWGSTTNYACTRGTAFVSGTAASPVTVAGADDVVVTGDLKVNSTSGVNVIGLIAGGCVWIYNPVNSSGNNLSSNRVNTIQAAILALRHSFLLQNYDKGGLLGTLNVTGAIAQRYRGPVGSLTNNKVSRGYLKNYVYDSRLAYAQPPYFLKSANSPFKVISLTDK